jgi:Thiamine pyrophosphate enzyme, central domain
MLVIPGREYESDRESNHQSKTGCQARSHEILRADRCALGTRAQALSSIGTVGSHVSDSGTECIAVPLNQRPIAQSQTLTSRERSKRNVPGHVSSVLATSAQLPDPTHLAHAVSTLNAGRKTAILAGRGALGASNELLAVAERLAAPIIKPLLGKGAVSDDSRYTTGGSVCSEPARHSRQWRSATRC